MLLADDAEAPGVGVAVPVEAADGVEAGDEGGVAVGAAVADAEGLGDGVAGAIVGVALGLTTGAGVAVGLITDGDGVGVALTTLMVSDALPRFAPFELNAVTLNVCGPLPTVAEFQLGYCATLGVEPIMWPSI